jgi:hypothetical protein
VAIHFHRGNAQSQRPLAGNAFHGKGTFRQGIGPPPRRTAMKWPQGFFAPVKMGKYSIYLFVLFILFPPFLKFIPFPPPSPFP